MVIDIFVCLGTNAHFISIEKDYRFYQNQIEKLEKENEALVRETAHLSSLKRISQKAMEIGLAENNERIVSVSYEKFAMR